MLDKLSIPLYNFYLEKNKQELKLRENERLILIRDPICNIDKYFIELPYQNETPRLTLECVITLFKLFDDKFIFSNTVSRYIDNKLKERDTLPNFQPFEHRTYDAGPYLLETRDEDKFREFWARLIDMPYDTTYALQKFNLADHRPYCIDCFLDYVASIESLLVPDEEEGSPTTKFCNRGAIILCDDENKKSKGKYISNTYSLRSDIIHGNERVKEVWSWEVGNEWKDHINQIRKYNRLIIRYIIKDNYELLGDVDKRKKKMQDLFNPTTHKCC